MEENQVDIYCHGATPHRIWLHEPEFQLAQFLPISLSYLGDMNLHLQQEPLKLTQRSIFIWKSWSANKSRDIGKYIRKRSIKNKCIR